MQKSANTLISSFLLECTKNSYGLWNLLMQIMEDKKLHYRHLMLYFFRKGVNAAQTAKRICEVYGEDALSARTVCKWFAHFRAENFELDDRDRSGRPRTVDDKRILKFIETHPEYSTRKIAEMMQISHASVKRHLKCLKFLCKERRKKTDNG